MLQGRRWCARLCAIRSLPLDSPSSWAVTVMRSSELGPLTDPTDGNVLIIGRHQASCLRRKRLRTAFFALSFSESVPRRSPRRLPFHFSMRVGLPRAAYPTCVYPVRLDRGFGHTVFYAKLGIRDIASRSSTRSNRVGDFGADSDRVRARPDRWGASCGATRLAPCHPCRLLHSVHEGDELKFSTADGAATPYPSAGIRIANIAPDAKVLVKGFVSDFNQQALMVKTRTTSRRVHTASRFS